MARNRKRAKERRGRRPQPAAASARGDRSAPDPIAHATPDSELAEAQLALGRPELAPESQDDVVQAAPDEEQLQPTRGGGRGGYGEPPVDEDLGQGGEDGDGGAHHPVAAPSSSGNRLVNFIQGSWRELQRVQWPDRRQVMQATGVVIGFVIVAGIYLGAADWVAGKIVSLIIK